MTIPKSYYRIMLGGKSKHAETCYQGRFIGADYDIDEDLTGKLPENWREFNKAFIPIYLAKHPDKSKIAAGLACGMLHTVAKGIKIGDIVLCPNGSGSYWVGEVISDYSHHPGDILPHRRRVQWYPKVIDRSEMGPELQKSTGSIGTVSTITKHAQEIEQLICGINQSAPAIMDKAVEDPTVFALEKHLEDFLVHNWPHTILGHKYDIFEEEGEPIGGNTRVTPAPSISWP